MSKRLTQTEAIAVINKLNELRIEYEKLKTNKKILSYKTLLPNHDVTLDFELEKLKTKKAEMRKQIVRLANLEKEPKCNNSISYSLYKKRVRDLTAKELNTYFKVLNNKNKQ